MFDQVIQVIAAELNRSIIDSDNTLPGDNVKIARLNEVENSENSKSVVLSMIHFEMENALRNQPVHRKSGNNIELKEPPVFINTYMMAASSYSDYGTQLTMLNYAMEFFQSKPYLDQYNLHMQNELPWPVKVEKVIFEWHNLDFDKLNQIWSLNGGKYVPSFLYKVRMMVVEKTENATMAPAVKDIRFDSSIH
jgi:Pvc16 N-terminal domain